MILLKIVFLIIIVLYSKHAFQLDVMDLIIIFPAHLCGAIYWTFDFFMLSKLVIVRTKVAESDFPVCASVSAVVSSGLMASQIHRYR